MNDKPRAQPNRTHPGGVNLLYTIEETTPHAIKAPAPPGRLRLTGVIHLPQTLKNLLRRRGETMNAMKSHTNPRLWTTILSILVILAALLNSVSPALAAYHIGYWDQNTLDEFNQGLPYPRTKVETCSSSGCGDGTGAVRLAKTTGSWVLDYQADWTNPAYSPTWNNTTASSGSVVLTQPTSEWVRVRTDPAPLNKSGSGWSPSPKSLTLTPQELSGATSISTTANLWRSTPNSNDRTVYMEVYVGATRVINASYSSSTPQDFSGGTTTINNTIQLRLQGSSWWWGAAYNTAYHNNLVIDVYKPVYATSGTATHTYNAGRQVRWLTHTPDPSSSGNIAYAWLTSNTGLPGSWTPRSTWADVRDNPSQYLQQVATLTRISQTETPSLNSTTVTYEYYDAPDIANAGYYTSPPIDPQGQIINGTRVGRWENIRWSPTTQPGSTEIRLRTAHSDFPSVPVDTEFVGPNCTTDYYTNPNGQAICSNHNGHRYLWYRAYLISPINSSADTPLLDYVRVNYNQVPVKPDNLSPLTGHYYGSNTPELSWRSSDPEGDPITYRVEMATTSDFQANTIVFSRTNWTGTTVTVTPPLTTDSLYYWRVYARDIYTDSDASDVNMLRLDTTPPNSNLTYPVTGTTYGGQSLPWNNEVSGSTADPNVTGGYGSGVRGVQVAVRREGSGGGYWNGSITSPDWSSSDPNWLDASPDSPGDWSSWRFSLPDSVLTDGADYRVAARGYDWVSEPQGNPNIPNYENPSYPSEYTLFHFDRTIGVQGRIWRDNDGNGQYNELRPGIGNVTVDLYNASGLVAYTETNTNGDYVFSGPALGLMAGTYTITVNEADPDLAGLTLTSNDDSPLTAYYQAGQKVTVNFGYGPFALIEGTVFDDNGAGGGTARNGVRDVTGTEPGLPNITVALDGSTRPNVTTNANGRYRFKGVPAGSYAVNPNENDPDMPSPYYVATSADPLAVNDVALGEIRQNQNVGYALPPVQTKSLYLHTGSTMNRTQPTGVGTSIGLGSNPIWQQSAAMEYNFGLDMGRTVGFYLPGSGSVNIDLRIGGSGGTQVASGGGSLGGTINLTPLVNTVPSGQRLWLGLTGSGSLNYDGTAPNNARVDLPAVTYVKITALGTYNAAYPGGAATTNFETHQTVYVRVTATDPFGESDISGANVTIPGVGTFAMSRVYNSGATRIYEYAYVDAAEGDYNNVQVTVNEGSEGTVSASAATSFRVRSADVWIAKSATPGTVQSQDVVTFTLNYGNSGILPAQNVVITDLLPSGLSYAPPMVSGPSPVVNGQLLTWNLANPLNSGATGQLVFRATVDVTGTEHNTFVNRAGIRTTTGEADVADNASSATVTLDQSANLTVVKSATDLNGGDLRPGDTLRYRLTIHNTGYADATGGTVTDAIDADTTFADNVTISGGTGTPGSPPNLVTNLTIPGKGANPYSEVIVEFDVTVNSPLPNGREVTNSAIVNTTQTGPVSSNVVTLNVTSDHNLFISKEPSSNPAAAGSTLVYTITWQVIGDEPAPSVVVRDRYPSNSTYAAGHCSPAPCSESGGWVTWILGDISSTPSGVSGQVYLTVTVNSPQPDRTPLNNHVEISDGDLESAQFDYSGFVGSGHTLSIVKSDSPDPVNAGGLLTYDLTYSVSGNENAQGVFITDTLPVNTTFWSCTGACQDPGVGSTGVVTWSIGNVAVNTGGVRQLVVRVASLLPQGTQIVNTAYISDTNRGAPSSEGETTNVNVWHSYTITKDDNPATTVEAGALLAYTIHWQINASSTEPVTGIYIEDTTPAHTTFSSCDGGCANPGVGGTGLVRWDIAGTHNPGDSGDVTLVVRVNSPLQNGLVLHNTATINDDDNDSAATSPDQTTTVHSDHTLWVTKTDAPDPVQAGALLTYTIQGGVPGTDNAIAPNVIITDRLPAHTGNAACSGASCNIVGDLVTWYLGNLNPGDNRTVQLTVRVETPLLNLTPLSNVAYISDDDHKTANSGTIGTTVNSDHDLRVTKSHQGNRSADEADAVIGWIDYAIQYWVPGDGNEPAPNTVITDAIPANTAYEFGSCQPAALCSYAGGVLTWNLGTLVPGNSGQASFRVNLPNPLPDGTLIHNTARIFDTDGEAWQADDAPGVTVRSDHYLTISKSDAPDPVDAGSLLTYTINYAVPAGGTTGNEPAPNVRVEDVIPLYTTFYTATGAPTIEHPSVGGTGLVRWRLGTLMPGQNGIVRLVVRVDSPLDNGQSIYNSANILDDDNETALSPETRTSVRSDHHLYVDKSDPGYDPVNAGDPLVYTILYTVTGNESSYGATLADDVPANTTYQGCSGGVLCSRSGSQVTWILNQLNPGRDTQIVTGTAYLILSANSPLPDPTTINNTVRFYDNETPQVSDSEATTVHSNYNYTIQKSAALQVESGAVLTYTINWSMSGNRPVSGVTITDAVPANTSYAPNSCSGGVSCSETDRIVTWNLGSLNPPTQGQAAFRVNVNNYLPNGTEVVNRAVIQDAATARASDPVTTTVHSDHQLALSKLDSPDPAEAGSVLQYTLYYTVTGNQYAPNVVLRDTIPYYTTFWDCAGCAGPDSSGVISWTLGTLAPPTNGSVSFRVRITDVLPSGTLIYNFANLSDGDGKYTSAYAQTTVSSHHSLTLVKSDNGYDPVQAGDYVTYTITYGVPADGNEPAPNVVIQDSTPLHTTFYTATGGVMPPDTPSVGGTGSVTWYLGDLMPGASGVVTLVVHVDSPLDNPTTLNNTANISDDDGGSASDSEPTTVQSSHHFDIDKTGNVNVQAGDYIDYSITFTVRGNEGANSIVITDAIPANTTYNGCGGDVSCTNLGAYVRWSFGDRDPGQGGIATLRVRTTSPLPDGTHIVNVANISDSNNGTPNSDDHDTLVGSGHTLSVIKSDDPDPAQAGGLINYTIAWSVAGTEAAQNVVITDRVPLSTTFQSASGGVTPDANGVVTWSLNGGNPINPGQYGDVNLTVQVDSVLPDGVYLYNTAVISDANGGRTPDTENTRVNANHTLTVDKLDNPDPVSAGTLLVYTLHWSVAGNEPAPNVRIQDNVPANTSFYSCAGGNSCDNVGGLVTWSLGDHIPGDSGVVTLTVLVQDLLGDGTLILNQATILDSDGVSDSSAQINTTVQSAHALYLVKSDPGSDPVVAGGRITYTIQYNVTGHEVARGVMIRDQVPANTTYQTCSGGTLCGDAGGGLITWQLGDLNPGQSGTVYLYLNANSPLPDPTTIHNVATIQDNNGGATASDDEDTTVTSSHDLSIAKSDAGYDPVQAGGQVTYILNYAVLGNQVAHGVVVTDRLPAEMSFVSCTGGCSAADGLVTWNLGDLAPGAGSVTLRVAVTNTLPNNTVLTNLAGIHDADGAGHYHQFAETTTVNSSHVLHIAKDDTGYDPVAPGGNLRYTINWSVTGNEAAQNIVITDRVPVSTTFVSVEDGGIQANGVVTWNIPTANPNASGTVHWTVQANPFLVNGTRIQNTVYMSDGNYGTPANASQETTVSSGHALHVTKTDVGYDPVEAGAQITYTLRYTVTGDEQALGVTLVDTLPSNTTFVRCTGGCSNVSNTATWNLGNLNPGANGNLTLVVNVAGPLPTGTLLTNQVNISDGNGGASGSDSEDTTVHSSHSFILTKSDSPDPIAPNGVINYLIRWEVTGNEAAQTIVITDAIPTNTHFESCGTCEPHQAEGYVLWTLPGLHNPGENNIVSLQVRVNTPLTNGVVIHNVAYIGDANNGTPQQTTPADTTVASNHTLALDKTGPSGAAAGDQLQYTLNYQVSGDEPAPNVILTDTVPANTTFVNADVPYTGPDANRVITWSLGSLNPGANSSVHLTVRVDDLLPNGTRITNTARLSDGDTGTLASVDSVVTTVTSSHSFSLAKNDTPDPVQAGAQLTYNLVWGVAGSETARGVTVVDTLPAEVTYVNSAPAGVYDAGNRTVTWNLGDIAPVQVNTITLIVNVAPVLPNLFQFTNQARITDTNGGAPVTVNEQTTVNSQHTLDVEKSAHASTIQAGGQITYTIVWGVAGNEAARNLVIVDNTPNNTTFASASSSVPATIETPGVNNSGPVRWRLGNQPPNATGVVTLVVNVASPLDNRTVIANTATIADENSGVPDASSINVTVESAHQLNVTKTGEGSVAAGDIIHYTIAWSVSGNEMARTVVITDRIPANTTFENCSGGDSCNHNISTGIVTWQLSNRNPDTSGNVNLQVRTVTPLPNGTLIENTANISDANLGSVDQDHWTTLVGSGHAYNLTKTGAPDPVEAGGLLNYTLAYGVMGSETARGVIITDRVPVSTTVDWIGNGGIQTGDVIEWTLGDLPPNTNSNLQFRVRVATPLPNGVHIYNTAFISDTNGGRAQASEDTMVHSDHSLYVSKTDNPDPVSAGSLLTYTLHYRVTGNEPAPNVVVQDDLPADTTFVAAPGGNFDGTTVRWSLGSLVPGNEGDLIMVVRTNDLLPDGTFIFNQAHISDDDGAYSASLVQRTTLQSTHELHLEKRDDGYDPAGAGGPLVYTLHYTVTGQEIAQGVTIRDDIPANTIYVSCAGGLVCSRAGNRVTWIVGEVLPNQGGVLTLTLQVVSPLSDGTIITNEAIVSDDNGGTPVTAQQSTTIQSSHNLSIHKADLTDPVQAGALLTYTIVYTVNGNQMASGIVITDRLPANVLFQSATDAYAGPDASGVMTWTLGNLPPGVYGPILVTVRVNAPLPNGTVLTNVAAIYDDSGYRAESAADTTVGSAPNLTTSEKAVDRTTAAPGDALTYTITLRNTGNAVATGASLADALPDNTTWDGWITQNDAVLNGTNITWTGDVAPDADQVIAFRVRVNTPLDNGTVIANSAIVSDNFSGHNSITLGPMRTSINSEPNLATSHKLASLTEVRPNNELAYTITLINTGNMVAHNVEVLDAIPAHTSYVNPSVGATSGNPEYQAANRIRWTGDVAPSTNVVITFRVRVDLPLDNGAVIANSATANDKFVGHDLIAIGPVQTTITSAPNLSTSSKTVDAADAVPSQVLHYIITLTNTGDMIASTTVTDVLPAQVSDPNGQITVRNGPSAIWDLTARRIFWNGSVTPGTNVVIEYYATVNSPMDDRTVITNTATINDGVHGTFETSAAQTTVHAAPNLTTSAKQVDLAVAPPGASLEYIITLKNTGNMNAATARMTDTLPSQVTYGSGPTVVGGGEARFDSAGNQVLWNGPLGVGQAVAIRYNVILKADVATETVVTNTATVDDGHGSVIEIGPAQTTVSHGLSIRMTDDRDTARPGELVTYTIAFSGTEPLNLGAAGINIPAHTQFITASNSVLPDGGTVSWQLHGLLRNFSDSRNLVVRLDPVLDTGTVISTTAYVAGDGKNNQAAESLTVVSAPNWATSAKTADRYTVEPTARFTYTIYLTNTGTMHAHVTTLTDTLPSQVTYVDGSATSSPQGASGSSGAVSFDAATRRILWNGAVDVNSVVTITFAVTVNADVLPGTPIENYAYVGDEVNASTALPPCIVTTVAAEARPSKIYLPLIARSLGQVGPQLPDLVVTEIRVTPANPVAGQQVGVAVTIKNQGTLATPACFWIDLYINPTRLPITVNQGWFEAGSEGGLVWSLCGLGIGESVTLHQNDAHYWPDLSRFPGAFTSPRTYQLYAQVDSYNQGTTYGAVYESNEQNNVSGPLPVVVGGSATTTGTSNTNAVPPKRPNVPPQR